MMRVSVDAASDGIVFAGVGVTYQGSNPWHYRVSNGVVRVMDVCVRNTISCLDLVLTEGSFTQPDFSHTTQLENLLDLPNLTCRGEMDTFWGRPLRSDKTQAVWCLHNVNARCRNKPSNLVGD